MLRYVMLPKRSYFAKCAKYWSTYATSRMTSLLMHISGQQTRMQIKASRQLFDARCAPVTWLSINERHIE